MMYGLRIAGLAASIALSPALSAPTFAQTDTSKPPSVETRMRALEAQIKDLTLKLKAFEFVEIQTPPSSQPYCHHWLVEGDKGRGSVVLVPCLPQTGHVTWHLVPSTKQP